MEMQTSVTTPYYQLYLSDSAWAGLIIQARATGHVREGIKPRGVSQYMRDVLNLNPTPEDWVDQRPTYIKESVEADLESGRTSVWDTGELRYFRNLHRNFDRNHASADLALAMGVVKTKGLRGRGDRFSEKALTSEFWEAVGIGWLAPTRNPTFTHLNKPRKKEEELIW